MKKITLTVEGMTCGHCENRVKKALLAKKRAIKEVEVSHVSGSATITYNEDKISLDEIKEIIEESGYDVKGN